MTGFRAPPRIAGDLGEMGHVGQAEPWTWPAVRLAEGIARKELSPVEVVEAVLARIERLNGRLNAFCTVTRGGGPRARRAGPRTR